SASQFGHEQEESRPYQVFPAQKLSDPDGSKYKAAYFDRFDNVWCHGDFAEWTEHGGLIIHGRSDATLNPGGVRIGTAEIYNQVEQMEEILEAPCIGQAWEDDVRVVLFVRLAEGVVLDEALEKKIRAKIRTGASPRHVPARIVPVTDIPRTKSGKITELAVRDVVHGRPVKNRRRWPTRRRWSTFIATCRAAIVAAAMVIKRLLRNLPSISRMIPNRKLPYSQVRFC
ncbi:MAG: hypothetical protein NVV63_00005, partial [Opitutus sp.]|nr:hypothetical protein [Opitutus sp.]